MLLTDVTQRVAQDARKKLWPLQKMSFSGNQVVWCVTSVIDAAQWGMVPTGANAESRRRRAEAHRTRPLYPPAWAAPLRKAPSPNPHFLYYPAKLICRRRARTGPPVGQIQRRSGQPGTTGPRNEKELGEARSGAGAWPAASSAGAWPAGPGETGETSAFHLRPAAAARASRVPSGCKKNGEGQNGRGRAG